MSSCVATQPPSSSVADQNSPPILQLGGPNAWREAEIDRVAPRKVVLEIHRRTGAECEAPFRNLTQRLADRNVFGREAVYFGIAAVAHHQAAFAIVEADALGDLVDGCLVARHLRLDGRRKGFAIIAASLLVASAARIVDDRWRGRQRAVVVSETVVALKQSLPEHPRIPPGSRLNPPRHPEIP
jgi:hypothetical protein